MWCVFAQSPSPAYIWLSTVPVLVIHFFLLYLSWQATLAQNLGIDILLSGPILPHVAKLLTSGVLYYGHFVSSIVVFVDDVFSIIF